MTSSEDSKDPMHAAWLYTEILQMGRGANLENLKEGGTAASSVRANAPPQTPLNTSLCAVKERYLLMYDVALLIYFCIYYDISILVSIYAN